MIVRRSSVPFVLCALGLGIVSGCSSSTPANATADGGPSRAGIDAGVIGDDVQPTVDSGTVDASDTSTGPATCAPDMSSAACSTLDPCGAPTIKAEVVTTAPPTMSGGTVATGKYFLTAATLYASDDAEPPAGDMLSLRYVIEATPTEMKQIVFDDALGQTASSTVSYTMAGTTLTTMLSCPAPRGASSDTQVFQYSASTTQLKLLSEVALLVFTKQ